MKRPTHFLQSEHTYSSGLSLVILPFSNKELALIHKTLVGIELSTFNRVSLTLLTSFSLLYSSATPCDQETNWTHELWGLMHNIQLELR